MTDVAILGGAHIHTPGFVKKLAQTDGINTKYVYDDHAQTAAARQEVCGGQIAEDVQTVLHDKDVQAVVICSQTIKHRPLVEAAADAGKHMFVEKPLGMNAEDAYAMAKKIEKAGVIFQTGYFQRGKPEVRFLRDQIQSGTFGKITRLRLSNAHHGALGGWFDTEWRWMADPEQSGCGGYGDLGTHVLDIMLWIMENHHVTAATGVIGSVTDRYPGCDEFGEGLLKFDNGAAGTIAGGWVDRADPNYLEISGTQGHAAINSGGLRITCENLDHADGKQPFKVDEQPWPHAFDLFLEAVKTGGNAQAPLVTPREAAYRNAVMEAIYDGSASQSWVSPSVPK